MKGVKERKTFRFSDETVRKLDEIVVFENESLRELGILGVSYDRTKILEILIEKGYQLVKEGKSIQDEM